MPNIYQKCGKEFYSDTKYEQHVFMHEQIEFLHEAKEAQQKTAASLGGSIGQLAYIIETATIVQLALTKNLGYIEATKEYLEAVTTSQRIIGARNQLNAQKKVVATCGYFDPLHDGHRSHFKAARALGDKLVVITHPDELCIKKKGWYFKKLADRVQDLLDEPDVDDVIVSIDHDGTVAETLKMVKPKIFAKGGDRNPEDKPIPQSEIDACEEIGCKIVYNVGEPKRPEWSSTLIGKKALGVDK